MRDFICQFLICNYLTKYQKILFTRAGDAVTIVTKHAGAGVAGHGVGARRVVMANVCGRPSALVDICILI